MEQAYMSHVFHITKLDKTSFAACQKALHPKKVPIEQSPIWGKFDEATVGRTYLGSFRYDNEKGQLIAILSATLYRQKGRDWIWIKHGPLFASVPNTEIIKKMCATLIQQFKNIDGTRPLFIRLTMPGFTSPLRLPFEHTMYDETVVIDLTKSEEALLADMSQSGRQGIRKANTAHIVIRELTQTEATEVFCKEFYPILAETAKRGGFGIHPCALYETMLKTLSSHAKLYGAYEGKTIVAWAITTEYDGTALYYYGASNLRARDTHAPYLLHWEIIKAMRKRGNRLYDLMGIAGKHYPSLKNVSQFKMKFSKDIQKIPLTYDLPLQPLKYHVLTTALKAKRRLS